MTSRAYLRTGRAARELLQVMERQLDLGRKMLALANAQTDALAAHDMARLMATSEQIRVLTIRQDELERARIDAAEVFTEDGVAMGSTGPTAAQIAKMLVASDARRLMILRDGLLDVQRKLQTVTTRNRLLLSNAQDITRMSLDLLVRVAMAPPRYGASTVPMRAPTLYLDQRA
jgi:hypothetical protein